MSEHNVTDRQIVKLGDLPFAVEDLPDVRMAWFRATLVLAHPNHPPVTVSERQDGSVIVKQLKPDAEPALAMARFGSACWLEEEGT